MNRNDHPPAPIAGELVLEFRGRRVETEDEIIEIEDALVEVLPDGDALQAHEIESEVRRIVVTTRDATETLRRLLPFLERAGLADDLCAHARIRSDTGGVRLWPPDRRQAHARHCDHS